MEKLLDILSSGLHEKSEAIRLALLSSLAGESIFLLGPPGVAKSLIARRLKHAYQNAVSFEYLMGRFSTPDEIFGPISIKRLKDEDRYERITRNYLPDADIVFLDEIWKASPAIQNSLLTALNEKLFRNGQQEIQLKIKGIIAASNELPEHEGLEALWDRFIIRLFIQGIQDSEAFERMIVESHDLYQDRVPDELKITDAEYKAWGKKIGTIRVPEEVIHLIHIIRRKVSIKNMERQETEQERIYISDRRWKKIVRLLRTAAFLNDRDSVDIMDCFLISHCIWNNNHYEIQEMSRLVSDAIEQHAYQQGIDLQPVQAKLHQLEKEVDDEITEKVDVLLHLPKKYNNNLYKIMGFAEDSDRGDNGLQAFIEKETFESLQAKPRKSPVYFGAHGSAMKYKKAYSIRKENECHIMIKDKIYPIETEWRAKKQLKSRKPSKTKQEQWNHIIGKLDECCCQRLNLITEYIQKAEAHASSHLFVSDNFSQFLFANLHSNSRQIDCMRLEMEKIRNRYESIV